MSKYGLHGKLQAQPGKGNQLAAILLEASQLIATAKGCRLYLVSKDKNEMDAIWVTEVWDSKADHDDSLEMPEVKELLAQATPILDGMPQKGQELEVLGGID